ncbi:probable dolichyl pyrophosphate Glc1Man9GlcNAc2 alpha-1,3-glucosyltransferase [Panonychus citri]|uniref:probable dolichyl pyrophosphate Glc1Man9GlcNAc2 alpha-1,3-glucosyltransferase n=1 Tax=Panonychus citri TaxID=50023 RepID=UPI0023072AF6|nr:probable dolichyl pyrophosphate Glc1Man9GlcNAc2 alpha-1,3-glucosyltransferase [Panonychus citri]
MTSMLMFYHLVVASSISCLKFLLMPSYYSTDFEVHRNWLALTSSKPISQWYFDTTSKWTLDYPPLFAWFEMGLSLVAPLFDPKMLVLSKKPYSSYYTIFYQRLSVIVTDLIYIYAAFQWIKLLRKNKNLAKYKIRDELYHPAVILSFLLLWNPGLLIVDHIHFQYNGLLSGIFLLSLARMAEEKFLESAFWFTILLNMKHIYLYVAPAYFIYLLRVYCFDKDLQFLRNNFVKLSSIVGGIFIFSLGPFIVMGQLGQLFSRLFPFGRGLTHAYWAPNFWALYNGVDKVLSILLSKKVGSASMTGGLVQQYQHTVLPNVPPFGPTLISFLSMLPILTLLWKKCDQQGHSPTLFIRSVILCAFSSFIFGYHVHEKAILMIILPLTPLALISPMDANIFFMLSTIGTYSLFPLLFKTGETPTKICLLLLFTIYCYQALTKVNFQDKQQSASLLLPKLDLLFLLGIPFLQIYQTFGPYFIPFYSSLPFLPLLLTSIYCALGVMYLYVKSYLSTYKLRNIEEF